MRVFLRIGIGCCVCFRGAKFPFGLVAALLATTALTNLGLATPVAAQTFLDSFGGHGSGDGKLDAPYGMDISTTSGNLYVADFVNRRVDVFDPTGVFISKITSSTPGSNPPPFNFKPIYLAISPSTDNIFASDYLNHRVQVFNSSGSFVGQFGTQGTGSGQFDFITGIAISPINGNVYIADAGNNLDNNRIQVFTQAGTFVTTFGSAGAGQGQFNLPWGIGFANSGELYVADVNNHRIQAFDGSGTFLRSFGNFGSNLGEFGSTLDVKVSPYTDNVFVADTGNHRIQIFNQSGSFLRSFASSGAGSQPNGNLNGLAIGPAGLLYASYEFSDVINRWNADLTYTDTVVEFGALIQNSTLTGVTSVTVKSGGTLGGTGTVPTTTINDGGTLMPGLTGVPGTLNISGNLTFASAATYLVAINGATASTTGVTGTATLGSANVQVASGSTITAKQKYTILTAPGGLGGTTFNPTVNFGAYIGTLSYDPNNVFLTLNIDALTPQLPSSAPVNVSNISKTIDAYIVSGGTLPTSFNTILGLTGSALTNALTRISGEAGAGGGRQGASQMMGSFLTLALNPFGGSSSGNIGGVGGGRGFGFAAEAELPREAAEAYAAVTPRDRRAASALDRRWGIWGQAYGGYNTTGGDTGIGTHDITSRSYGVATGADYHAAPDLMVGFALAGGGTNYGLSDGLGGGKSDVFQIGFYGSKQFGPAYVSASLSYAWHGMKTDRTVTISGTDNLTASFNAHSFGGRLESGYKFDVPFVSFTPYAALQMQQFRTPSYSETAASGSNAFALSYDAKSTTSTRTELGVWLDKMIALSRGNVLAIRTRAAWAHDHSSDESSSAAFQTLPGSNFTVNGAGTVPNSALMSAGAEIQMASGVSFGGKFDGEFAYHSQTYAGTITVRSVW